MVPKVKRFREWLVLEMQTALAEHDGGWGTHEPVPAAFRPTAQAG
jgi:hypothetical protein